MSTLSAHNSGMASLLLGKFDDAIAHFDTALSLRAEADLNEINRYYPAEPRTIDIVMRCWARALKRQDLAETEDELKKAIGVAEAEESEFSRCFALSIIATIYCTLDDPEKSRTYAREAHTISERIKFQYWEAWSGIVLGWAEARCGRTDTGITALRDGLERYSATGSAQILAFATTLLADAYLSNNEVTEAATVIAKAQNMLANSSTGFHTHITNEIAAKIRSKD